MKIFILAGVLCVALFAGIAFAEEANTNEVKSASVATATAQPVSVSSTSSTASSVSSDCFEYCVKTGADESSCKMKCTAQAQPAATSSGGTTDALTACLSQCTGANETGCKSSCYAKTYGEGKCKKICDKDSTGKEYCKELCEASVAQTTISSAPSAVSTTPIDPLMKCIQENCGSEKENGEYAYCKQKCYSQTTSSCQEVCEVNALGMKECKQYCAIEAVAPPTTQITVASDGRDTCFVKCKAGYEDKTKLITTTADGAKKTEIEVELKSCFSNCEGSYKTAVSAQVPTLVSSSEQEAYACVKEKCFPITNDNEAYSKCKMECYKMTPATAVAATPYVTGGGTSTSTAPVDKCAMFSDSAMAVECKKIQQILEAKQACAPLAGDAKNSCILKAYATALSNEDVDYQNYLTTKIVNPTAVAAVSVSSASVFSAAVDKKKNELLKTEPGAANAVAEGGGVVTAAANRLATLQSAAEKAKAKGHDTTELDYLVVKYGNYVEVAKQNYAAGSYKEALQTVKGAEALIYDFKKILTSIVQENAAGIKHAASSASPVTVTESVAVAVEKS